MPAVLGLLVVGLALGVLAFGAASSGRGAAAQSRDGKQAYAAAESGLNWYLSRLVADNAYWSKCTTVRSPTAPVNNPWNGAGTDPRQWRSIPDSSGNLKAEYAIELLPANGTAACSVADPNGTMIDNATRTFRIRAVGRYGTARRAIVANFRRARFLDFVYLTEYETTDPLNYTPVTNGWSADTYEDKCANQLRAARDANAETSVKRCREIQFANADVIEGPLHSNDSLLTCGSPKFGRLNKADAIQTAAPAPGYVRACSGTPSFRPALVTAVSPILMPTTFASISSAVRSDYRFTGRTTIRLAGDQLFVRTGGALTETQMDWPDNGLVYVDSGTSCAPQKPSDMPNTGSSSGCADAYVSGTYSRSITVAAANDVVVTGAVQGTNTDAVAGLIADRFVRVYHPTGIDGDGNCQNASGSLPSLEIQAAILAVHHSFTVDNYDCGANLKSLSVTGGIAQNYRGAVGTGAGSGYLKDYTYDDRFVYRSPPFFLEPAAAAWRVVRVGEQARAR